MPHVVPNDYNPNFPFTNGHINTFYPFFFRKNKNIQFKRTRITTPDDDFLDIDMIQNGYGRIVLLCHGLEGSSSSQYMMGTADTLRSAKWDVAAMNYRGCSGEANNQLRVYHSGATDDLDLVVQHLLPKYDEVVLIGFSLGGNLVLKYCNDGVYPISDKITTVFAISTPTDLRASSLYLQKKSNWFYEYRFLKNLRNKIVLKDKQFPKDIDLRLFEKINTLYDFDNYFTAPLHGYKDADDYYSQCSCGQFLNNVTIPSYLINAMDDPFLPEECFPTQLATQSKLLTLITPKYGGHVGFTTFAKSTYWDEQTIKKILSSSNQNI